MYSCRPFISDNFKSLALCSSGFEVLDKLIAAPVALIKDSSIVKVNDSLCTLLGYSPAELHSKNFINTIIYDNREYTAEEIYSDSATRGTKELHVKAVSNLQEIILCTLTSTPVTYEDEPAFLLVIKDYSKQHISERKQRDHLYFLENLRKIETAIGESGTIQELMTNVLRTVLAIFGCERAWLLFPCDPTSEKWQVPMEVTHPDHPGAMALNTDLPMTEDVKRVFTKALKSDEPIPFYFDEPSKPEFSENFGIKSQLVMPLYPKTGKPWLMGVHQCSIRRVWTSEDIKFFHEVGNRLTDSLSSLLFLNTLKESEQKFRNYIDSAPDAIFVTDKYGNYTDFNRAACTLTGFTPEELYKKKTRDIITRDTRKNFVEYYKKLLSSGTASGEIPVIISSGEKKWWSVQAVKLSNESFLIFAKDISLRKGFEEDQKKLKAQLLHAQKMEAVGTLAGGIAHDFNNILSAIIGYTQLSIIETEKDNRLYSYLKKIASASERAREMIRQIMTFSRRTNEKKEKVQLASILNEVLQLIRPTLPSTITIDTDIAEGLNSVTANPSQLHQVVMNLCTNSFHAMSENGGTLTVNLTRSRGNIKNRISGDHSEQEYQVITIGDTGYGIPRNIIGRIFEPYFTTKNEGEGTGMGLAVTHGIITNMGGLIKVDSTPEEGTVIRVLIPEEEIRQPSIIESKIEKTKTDLNTGSETILLVDDEESLTEVMTHQLKKMGYKVTAFTSSVKALEFFRNNPDKFDLIITDLTMPSITGINLAKEVHKVCEDIPIILCTGYSDTRYDRENLLKDISAFLQKPVDMSDFSRIIRSVLDKNKK